MNDILVRVWENLVRRSTGPMNFRILVQPTVACIFAIRSGVKDGRKGRPAFLWAAITNPAYRPVLLRQGWKDVGKVFIVAIALDTIYQLFVHRGVYVLELLIVTTTLAILPYALLRGPVTRVAKWFTRSRISTSERRSSAIAQEGLQREQSAGKK